MRKDKQPGIDFEKIMLERINLEVTPDYLFPEKGVEVEMTVSVNAALNKPEKKLKLTLEVSLFKETKNPPLRLLVSASSYFKGKDIKTLEEFSKVQAPALVFPFVREIIANLTMRTGYPPFLVPPTNIVAFVGKKLEKTKQKTKTP